MSEDNNELKEKNRMVAEVAQKMLSNQKQEFENKLKNLKNNSDEDMLVVKNQLQIAMSSYTKFMEKNKELNNAIDAEKKRYEELAKDRQIQIERIKQLENEKDALSDENQNISKKLTSKIQAYEIQINKLESEKLELISKEEKEEAKFDFELGNLKAQNEKLTEQLTQTQQLLVNVTKEKDELDRDNKILQKQIVSSGSTVYIILFVIYV